MKYTKNVLNAVLGMGALSVFMIGGAFSYFTDNEVVTNVVTVGDVVVDLVVEREDFPEPENFQGIYMLPNEEIKIQTYAVNSGTEDIVVFMEVLFPVRGGVTYVSNTGVPTEREEDQRIGRAEGTSAVYDFLELNVDEWVFIENRSYYTKWNAVDEYYQTIWDVNHYFDEAYIGYIFGYREKLVGGKLVGEEDTTEPLFKGLICANFTEENIFTGTGIWEAPTLPVTIRVFAIQSELIEGAVSVSGGGSSVATTPIVLDDLDKTSLKSILNTFTNQNYNILINSWYWDADSHGKRNLDGTIKD